MVGYIVQKGDSLWKIAKENHTTVDNLRRSTALRRMRSSRAETADCQECALPYTPIRNSPCRASFSWRKAVSGTVCCQNKFCQHSP